MREIKFRAWDKNQNCMWSWNQLMSHKYNERWFVDNQDKDYINCRFTDTGLILEQYTGLKDKNGKEIFEGDIIKGDEPDFICKCIGVVCFKGISFVIKGKQLLTTEQQNDHCDHSGEWFFTCTGNPQIAEHILEIIGNIHENPELLTPKTDQETHKHEAKHIIKKEK